LSKVGSEIRGNMYQYGHPFDLGSVRYWTKCPLMGIILIYIQLVNIF
jgi:hypothetical protein